MAGQDQGSPDTATPGAGRLEAMQPSQIREIHNLYQSLKQEDPDRSFIPLHFGEPDLGTPQFIIDAACRALNDGAVFYEPNAGRHDLREALAEHFQEYYRVELSPHNFLVTCGGTQGIALSLLALVRPGDEVINITPNWPNFAEAARIAGARVHQLALRFSEEERVFRMDFQALEGKLEALDRPRVVIVNTPSNPTGWVMTAAEQERLWELSGRYGVYLLMDEMYDRIVFTEAPFPSALRLADLKAQAPEEWGRMILVNGFSKTYCMTGWRLGYLVSAPALVAEMARMQEFITSHAPSMAQVAGITALKEGEPFVAQSLERYRGLRDLTLERASALPGATAARSDGSFYSFFRLSAAADSVRFCKELLKATGVVLAPGSAFGQGGEGWLRLCFANEPERLNEAFDRVADYLGKT